jgi:hypothetical protein
LQRTRTHSEKVKKPTIRKIKLEKSSSRDIRSFLGTDEKPTDENNEEEEEEAEEKDKNDNKDRLHSRKKKHDQKHKSDHSLNNRQRQFLSQEDLEEKWKSKLPKTKGILTGSELIMHKSDLADKYFSRTDSNYKKKVPGRNDIIKKICKRCTNKQEDGEKVEMVLEKSLSIFYCRSCGTAKKAMLDDNKPSFKEPVAEQTTSPYKRINHQPY